METMNISFFISVLRLISVGVGIMDVVITGYTHYSEQTDEVMFFVIIICCFLFSLFLVLGYFSNFLTGTLKVKYIDVCFHFGGGLALLISGIFMMAAVIERNYEENDYKVERTIAALFGIQNGIMYCIIGTLLFKTVPTPPSKYGEGLEWEDPLIETVEAKKMDFGSFSRNS